jgi:hypothetical protein
MEHNPHQPSLFIARIRPVSTPVPFEPSFPLDKLQRREISFLRESLNIPVYPDRTNFGQENTRAQVRYTVFPVIDALGFAPFENHLAALLTLIPRKPRRVPRHPRARRDSNNTCAGGMILHGRVKIELPGTRTQNCPVKSRELYH